MREKPNAAISATRPFRVALAIAFVAALLLPEEAAAQSSALYVNREHRFAVIFPAEPEARDVTYSARDGVSVPARQFFVEGDAGRYAVTVVTLEQGRSADPRAVAHAADKLRRRGEVRFEAGASYDPGIPGAQLNIFETSGRQLRASVYMYDHRLYITETSAIPGDVPAIQFEQSIMLLDADGNGLDRSVFGDVFAYIGSVFGIDVP